MNSKNPWKTIPRNGVIYENKYGYKLREDDVLTPTGTPGKYMVLENNGYVIIVALTPENQLLLVRQWRYPINEEALELPSGHVNPKMSPLDAAKQELLEETGGVSNKWVELPWHWLGNGAMKIKGYVYLALNVELKYGIHSGEDEALSLEKMNFKEAIKNLEQGEFSDQRTQMGLLLAEKYLCQQN